MTHTVLQAEQPCARLALGASAEGGPHEWFLSADRNRAGIWRKTGLAQLREVHRSHTVVQAAGEPCG
jgi:hypothetical protein